MKQWLCGLLLFLFALQAVPLRELGKLLQQDPVAMQCDDEFPDCDCGKRGGGGTDAGEDYLPKMKKAEDWIYPFSLAALAPLQQMLLCRRALTAIHAAEGLPLLHRPDVQTPPPNRASLQHC